MRRIIIPALACMSLLPFHLHAEEAAKPLAFDTHDGPDSLTEESADGKTVLTIRGKGIGRSKLALDPDRKPQETILRIYLRGLESLAIGNDRVQWKASVSSHSGHATLLHLWQDGKEGPALTKDSPYWAEIQRLGPDGKPAAGLPPAEGWFELRIPEVLLKDSRELKFEWIDFYR